MEKIIFVDNETKANAETFNIMQDNMENATQRDITTNGEPVKCGYKIDGKDVYVKRINIGTLPNNTEITVDVGINSSTAQIVDIKITTIGSYQQKMPNNFVYSLLTPNGLVIGTTANLTSYTGIATIEFTYSK